MKTHRCFFDGDLATGSMIRPADAEMHHLLRVRRARADDRILVLNGRGREFEARVTAPEDRHPQLEVLAPCRIEEAPPRLPVLAPCLTPDTDSIIAACVELGVGAFRPLASERCSVRGSLKRPEALLERWRRLAISALKQCERLWLPDFHPPTDLKTALDDIVGAGERPLCLTERLPDRPSLLTHLGDSGDVAPTFLIGPEGGWSADELEMLEERRIAFATLGDGILRAETACVAALATSLAHRGAPGH